MNSPKTPQMSLSSELKDIITTRNMLTTRSRMKVLKALDEIQQDEQKIKQRSLRAQAIQEILTSEVSYLKQLEILIEYFMKPISERSLLDTTAHATLFENIETLYNVNHILFKELKEDLENIAQAFFKLAPFFKLYSVYAYNYKRALDLLQDIPKSYPEAATFISEQESRPEVNQKLSALLITPIQRIPRYKLLIKEVLRFTPPRHNDYKTLIESLIEIEKVAEHINSLVAEYEYAQKIIELQAKIVNDVHIIKPGRKLIRQGPLMRVSRKRNASYLRHFILFSDILLYCKGDPDHSLTVCCLLPLNKCKIEKVLSNKLFKIICKEEVLLVYSENGDSEEWIEALQNAVKKYQECRQTLRKDSSSRVPLRHVNRFTSDSKIDKRLKRRKATDDSSMDFQDSSKVIYMSKDLEADESFSNINCFATLIKRAKRSEFDENLKEQHCNKKLRNSKNYAQIENTCNNIVDSAKTGVVNNIRQYLSTIATSVMDYFTRR